MTNFSIFLFGSVGLVLILSKSKLFKPFREYLSKKNKESKSFIIVWKYLSELFNCSLCLGFWIGLGFYLLSEMPIISLTYSNFLYMLLYSFSSALWSKAIIALIELIDRK